jgi:outer membrane protein TolC
VAAGCTRSFFRQRADQDVEGLLEEKSIDPRWEVDNWHVYPDTRARFADFSHPDHPKRPPDDPGAAALAPNPQRLRSHMAAGPDQEGLGYLEFLRHCDQYNRAILAQVQEAEPKATLGTPTRQTAYVDPAARQTQEGYDAALRTNEQGFLINLEQALELSLFNSRDYQDRREDLYLAALPVTLQRFNLGTQLFAGVEAIRTWSASGVPGGPGSAWNINSSGTATRLLPGGATIVANLANRLAIDLSNGNPTIGLSNLTLQITQPLLQGGGWAVTLEPLTQAERTLVYGVRSYARFRKNFYVYIAGGADLGNGVFGYDGLGGFGGVGGTIGSPSQGYLPTLLATAFERNERENIRALTGYIALYREYQGRGDFSELQVGQVEQGILRGQASLLDRQQALQNNLDAFKVQLGVPPRTPLELEDAPIKPMREMLAEFAHARDEFQALRTEADQHRTGIRLPLQALAGSAIAPIPLDVPLRERIEALIFNSSVSRATKYFKATISARWDRWKTMTSAQVRAEIKKQSEELRELQVLEARYETRNEQLPPEQAARLTALPRDLAIGNLELSIREYDALRGKKEGTGRGTAILYEEAVNNFIRVMSEAREERRDLLRENWPKLPAVTVDGADLLKEKLDEAQTTAAQVALAERLELMNSRAQVNDAWRRITVVANSLLGVLNVGYNFDSPSTPNANQPFALGGSRSRHQLILNGELPLTRRAERNDYRAALIAYQRARRNLQATEDFILNDVRTDLRNLRVLAENYKIQQRAVELAFDQVENSLDVLQAPPIPEGGVIGQPGRAAAQGQQQAANAAALTSQLLSQQNNLLQAQNSLYQVWINYLIARMTFYRDIERLPLDPRGVWIDEFTSPPCQPELLPIPGAGGDPEVGGFAELQSPRDR